MTEPTEADIIADMKRVAHPLGIGPGQRLGLNQYLQHRAQYTRHQLYDGGNMWEALCSKAGFTTKEKTAVSDNAYFANLARAVKGLGRYPKASERKKYGLNFSKRRYPNLTYLLNKLG